MAVFMLTRYRAIKKPHYNMEMLEEFSVLSFGFCFGIPCTNCRFKTYTKDRQERCILGLLSGMANAELKVNRSTVELNGEIYDLEEIK